MDQEGKSESKIKKIVEGGTSLYFQNLQERRMILKKRVKKIR